MFSEGDLVRFKNPAHLRTLPRRGRWVTTEPFTIESINVDGRWDGEDADETWAEGHLAPYGSVEVWHPDEIELVMSAEAASKRPLPTLSDLMDHISSKAMSWGQGFDINGADTDATASLLFYGKTDEGLDFTFNVTVSKAERFDY